MCYSLQFFFYSIIQVLTFPLALDLDSEPSKPSEPAPLVPLSHYPNQPVRREPPQGSSIADISAPADTRQTLVLPPECGAWRNLLFHMDQPQQMSRTKFCQYWPFMTNVWSPNSTHTSKSGDKRSFFFRCRLYAKSVRPVAGGGMRATTRREGHSCPARLTITHFIGPDTFHLARPRDRTNNNAPCPGHTHTLDLLDQTKKRLHSLHLCRRNLQRLYPGTNPHHP